MNELLPYLSLKNTWLMPVLHALLYGVVQKYVQTMIEGQKGHTERMKVSFNIKKRPCFIVVDGLKYSSWNRHAHACAELSCTCL